MFILGFIFCSWNGYIQGFYHAKYAIYSANHTYKFASIIGKDLIGIFVKFRIV